MSAILVLAGVNGAGKSSLLGSIATAEGLVWFDPDAFTRELVATGCPHDQANSKAWAEGKNRLARAIADGEDHALETTLGGRTISALLREATKTHDVIVWFCGLSSVDLHIQRVAQRIAQGGHAVAEHRIRARHDTSRENLIMLMDALHTVHVYDNTGAAQDGVTEPQLVLELERGAILHPSNLDELGMTPEWAAPIVERALQLHPPAWLEPDVTRPPSL